MEAGATGVGVLGKGAVMLCFIRRNMYLVYLPVPSTELLKRLEFPK